MQWLQRPTFQKQLLVVR
ncbi:UNVERIFIED_CONTAM: hypothetical protein GTU68_040934 [Idotea baltica]|nr:hypothetical protein [Idotea baltica]